MKLYFVTQNPGKAREFQDILKEHEIIQVAFDYPELRADNVIDVVEIAAKSLAENMQKTVVVEDSGLFIEALNGFPGTCTSYVTKRIKNEGILKLLKGQKNRKAEFHSAIGYCAPGETPKTFFGKIEGKISLREKGKQGWGQDPIFIPRNYKKTFAELGPEVKNRISHRRKAVEKLREFLKSKIKA